MDNLLLWEKIDYYFKEFILFKIQDVGITISHLVVALVAVALSLLFSKIIRWTLNNPPPKVWFREFGESSLTFMLLCWIPHATQKFDIISELNYAIDRSFRDNNIEIPFPQRDLHLRSAKAKILFSQDPGD